MRLAVLGLVVAGVLGLGTFATVTQAAPAPSITAHRHYILVNGQEVNVGPDFCRVDANANGFAQFHANVHLTDPGLVDVKSGSCP